MNITVVNNLNLVADSRRRFNYGRPME